MRIDVESARSTVSAGSFPDQTFEAVVFDWDGTAVPNRRIGAEPMRRRVEALCRAGLDVVVVSGTHMANIDEQLGARPSGPGRLWLCINRGSQVAMVGHDGPKIVWERKATTQENTALDRAASLTVERLEAYGLSTRVVSQRMNRRKIDLIDDPDWSDPPKAQIASLLHAVSKRLSDHGISSLDAAVAIAAQSAQDAGLDDPRITTDAKHLEIGLTDKSDSLRWVLNDLKIRGVGPGLVLIVGDEMGPLGGVPGSDSAMMIPEATRSTVVSVGVEPEGVPKGVLHIPGGPEMFLGLLDNQLARRATRRVPSLDLDPTWTIKCVQTQTERLERVRESLLAVADGHFGTRCYKEEDGASSNPSVVAAGIYNDASGIESYLLGPRWADLELTVQDEWPSEWTLDLRSGVVIRTIRDTHGQVVFRSMRFASLAKPGTMALRAEGSESDLKPGPSLVIPPNVNSDQGVTGSTYWASTMSSRGGGITAAAGTTAHSAARLRLIERIAHYVGDADSTPSPTDASEMLEDDLTVGFDQLLAQQRHTWADRWERATISIEGDPDAQLAVRFALFHLMASVGDDGEAAVGARGLSGPAYAGHVFWDADIFVLPFLAATHPPAAQAILAYRLARIEAARANAISNGHLGARFPWESATTGEDVTPTSAQDAHGETVAIRTGQDEEHIVADVAWAAWHAAAWTGDRNFLLGPGRALIIETARWWASRATRDADGTAHLRGVIGPDEYHEDVDDNAFTNGMAAWNLRKAAELVEAIKAEGKPGVVELGEVELGEVELGELEDWRALANSLVDGYDAETGIYEQFAGFLELEPLIISEIASPPIAGDVLLGRQRVAGSQIIKQADVLMLHHLVPEACAPGSLATNLDFYAPRTAHGSSLSPAVHACLLARAGRANEALELFRLACRIDLDDLTGTTAGGLHLACLGGVWQALAFGFLGLLPRPDGLVIDPHLPDIWDSVTIAVVFRGVKVVICVERDAITVNPDDEISVVIGESSPSVVKAPGKRFARATQHAMQHPVKEESS